ncbi:hypothetical protein JIX56_40585 [Streptomyces sp. CA-210063]|uniref:hypothetical protein n=1 Tax=Streptomyces sp. CA-210063 TaxID=2801029 RepID=UPI00214B84A4|nr:hypothetical protein [Streptomyces sp. CA-210063]UUU35647.1 hypothetical protein JIX56_40585 [Streptomyces sp. CA-210063]
MSDDFNDTWANGGVAPDRWAGALHLFDNGAGVPHEERTAEAHLMLGRTLQRQGRHGEAEPWMRMAAAFSGEFPDHD